MFTFTEFVYIFYRLSEEEVTSLLEMITCKPPVTAAGVKFVSLGLCVLIACNSLTANPDNEKVAGLFIVTSHIFLHQNVSHENYNYVRFHEVFFYNFSGMDSMVGSRRISF